MDSEVLTPPFKLKACQFFVFCERGTASSLSTGDPYRGAERTAKPQKDIQHSAQSPQSHLFLFWRIHDSSMINAHLFFLFVDVNLQLRSIIQSNAE